MEDFYSKQDFKYIEIATCMDKFYKYRPGTLNFTIPIVTPYMSKSEITKTNQKAPTTNLLNKDTSKLKIDAPDYTNVIRIELPADLCYDCDNDDLGYVNPGEKFLISFIGGDINRPNFLERLDVTPGIIDSHQLHMAKSKDSFHIYKPGDIKFEVPIYNPFLKSIGMVDITAEIPIQVAATCPKSEGGIVSAGEEFLMTFVDGKLSKPVIVGRRKEHTADCDLHHTFEAFWVGGNSFDIPYLAAIASRIGLSLPVSVHIPDYYYYWGPHECANAPGCCACGSPGSNACDCYAPQPVGSSFGITFLYGDPKKPILVGVYS